MNYIAMNHDAPGSSARCNTWTSYARACEQYERMAAAGVWCSLEHDIGGQRFVLRSAIAGTEWLHRAAIGDHIPGLVIRQRSAGYDPKPHPADVAMYRAAVE
jgi:hypothetical protein